MNKPKKILLIAGIALDVAVTIFFFVIAIIMIAKSKTFNSFGPLERELYILENKGNLIVYLQTHLKLYLGLFVAPLFVLLALNIAVLVWYLKKSDGKAKVEISDLSEEQKEALKKELLNDLKSE